MKENRKSWLIVSLFLVTVGSVANANTIYVDADAVGSGTGANWANAYNYLQDALADANASAKPVEIRVAQGTYTPDSNSADPNGSGDRTATFQLINDVNLMGGFAGYGEADPNARDITNYETILSGDLDGNDVPVANPSDLLDEPTRAENSYHVLTASGTDANAVLDGFIITAGNANETVSQNRSGGGLDGGSPTLRKCIFNDNSAYRTGGGARIYSDVYNSKIINCMFSCNYAGYGAGAYVSNAMLTDCKFSDNSAGAGGGLYGSDLTMTNCTFTENYATGSGGGIAQTPGSLVLISCSFSGNSAGIGGGIRSSSDFILTNCTFSSNSAVDDGGGIYLFFCSPALTNCTFKGNLASQKGGGIFLMAYADEGPTLNNCTFSGNSAGNNGGGFSTSHGDGTFINCTFSENSAGGDGGAFCHFLNNGFSVFNNCILWGNTALGEGPQIALEAQISSTTSINSCDVQGDWFDVYVANSSTLDWNDITNIDVDPCFVDADGADDTAGTEDDDLRLASGSPCIDVGDNNSVPVDINDIDNDGNTVEPFPWDLDGRPRIIDGDCNDTDIVDMGAYEFGWLYLGDFAGGCDVDFVDFAVLGLTWRKEDGQAGYDPNCDISLPADSLIDEKDLKIFTDNWLIRQ